MANRPVAMPSMRSIVTVEIHHYPPIEATP